MTFVLTVENHGPLLVASNYWGSPADLAGAIELSINAGAFRLLLPTGWERAVEEMKTGKEVVVSRGPMAVPGRPGDLRDAFELLFDDGTDEPYSVHLGADQSDRLPTPDAVGQEWLCTVWTAPRRGKPHKALERPAWYRVVPRLPWLKPREKSAAGP